jgi:hypothetical protein
MHTSLSGLLIAVVMMGGVAVMRPAHAQVSIRIGPPPSRPHVWVPERRFWHDRRDVRGPGRWERCQARRWERERWRDHRRWDHRHWDRR